MVVVSNDRTTTTTTSAAMTKDDEQQSSSVDHRRYRMVGNKPPIAMGIDSAAFARSYYGMSESLPFDADATFIKKHRASSTYRTIGVILAICFGLVVVLSVAAAVVIVIIQEPVDVSKLRPINTAYIDGSSSAINRKLSYSKQTSIAADDNDPGDYRRLSFSDLIMNAASIKSSFFSLWLADDTLVMLDAEGNLQMIGDDGGDGASGVPSMAAILIHRNQFRADHKADSVYFNGNRQLVALARVISQTYRHSKKALYEIATLQNGRLGNHLPVGPTASGSEPIQLFEWNPAVDARDFVFVYENNIYYQPDIELHHGSALAITTTGNSRKYHGVANWVYEEEIFASSKALWWSKSGRYLAFASFDDKNITSVKLPRYDASLSYAHYDEIVYPKPGARQQPAVFLWIWDKMTNATKLLLPPEELFAYHDDSYYLFSASWLHFYRNDDSAAEVLAAVWSNRAQNDIFVSLCQYELSQCLLHYRQNFSINDQHMWAEPTDFTIKYQSELGYFLLLPHVHVNGKVYNHVAHLIVNANDLQSNSISGFHGGAYDVGEIVGYDATRDELFFLASSGDRPTERHLFRVTKAIRGSDADPQCVTCTLPKCTTASADFSPSGRRFVLTCTAAYVPARAYLKHTDNLKYDQTLRDESNERLIFDAPQLQFDNVRLSSGIDAQVGLLLPPNFVPTHRYPVLLYVYSGPGTNLVKSKTPWDILTYFSSQRQYVIVTVDARGSGSRGWQYKMPIYGRLGGPEVDDQIETMQLLLKRLPYLDSRSVAAFGWSYGGFVAIHIAARDAGNTFQCLAAIAPVTDFRLYDSVYTERYMNVLSDENRLAYEKTTVLANISNFRKVHFMLAHGESDDNVHYQHSAILAGALQERSIRFKQLVYPNQDHTLRLTLEHLYIELDAFLDDDNCLRRQKS